MDRTEKLVIQMAHVLSPPSPSEQSEGAGWWQASDGRWYPPQPPQSPPPPPARKRRHTLRWLALVVVAVIIAAIVANSGSKKSAAPSGTANTPTAPSAAHKIGDTATTSGWQVTVYGVQDPWSSSNQFETPTAGSRFVKVDVQARNTKGTQQVFSSLLSFKLLDSANRSFNETIVSVQPGPPEGQVPAGQAVRGFVTFDVPSTSTGLTLLIQGSFTAAGSRFTLS